MIKSEFAKANVEVLHEDEDVLLLNKPAGWIVNRSETTKSRTIQDLVFDHFVAEKSVAAELLAKDKTGLNTEEQLFVERVGMVHRIDKETSGVLLLAKNPSSLVELMRQFKDRETKKEYVALVHGCLKDKQGSIKLPLGRLAKDRKKFGVVLGGKMSETRFLVEKSWQGKPGKYSDGFSYVRLLPKTGRTHQLRVVLKHMGHTIVGDSHYLGKKRANRDAKWCSRHFLHAEKLEFSHPGSGKLVSFEAKIPKGLREALEQIHKWVLDV